MAQGELAHGIRVLLDHEGAQDHVQADLGVLEVRRDRHPVGGLRGVEVVRVGGSSSTRCDVSRSSS
ncbi:hypothetical protein SFR_7086 (plasmid) [Streptomyces sp. FR-008]|nr:hypothetical protein SFR_7086 [Streptomyces sp. FR-008]